LIASRKSITHQRLIAFLEQSECYRLNTKLKSRTPPARHQAHNSHTRGTDDQAYLGFKGTSLITRLSDSNRHPVRRGLWARSHSGFDLPSTSALAIMRLSRTIRAIRVCVEERTSVADYPCRDSLPVLGFTATYRHARNA